MRRALFLLPLLVLSACSAGRALAPDQRTPETPAAEPTGTVVVARTPIPTAVRFQPIQRRGVRGGQLTTVLPGTPEQVADMILDFDEAARHRSFAREMRVLSRKGNRVEVAISLKGKMGISPKIHVAYTKTQVGDAVRVEYVLTKKAFGISSYSGELMIEPVEGTPARSKYTSKTFVASGIMFAKVKSSDIERGQRTDAGELRTWMTKRLASR